MNIKEQIVMWDVSILQRFHDISANFHTLPILNFTVLPKKSQHAWAMYGSSVGHLTAKCLNLIYEFGQVVKCNTIKWQELSFAGGAGVIKQRPLWFLQVDVNKHMGHSNGILV